MEPWIRLQQLADRAGDHRRTEIIPEDRSAIQAAIKTLRGMERQGVPDADYYLQCAQNLHDRITGFVVTVLSKGELDALREAYKYMKKPRGR